MSGELGVRVAITVLVLLSNGILIVLVSSSDIVENVGLLAAGSPDENSLSRRQHETLRGRTVADRQPSDIAQSGDALGVSRRLKSLEDDRIPTVVARQWDNQQFLGIDATASNGFVNPHPERRSKHRSPSLKDSESGRRSVHQWSWTSGWSKRSTPSPLRASPSPRGDGSPAKRDTDPSGRKYFGGRNSGSSAEGREGGGDTTSIQAGIAGQQLEGRVVTRRKSRVPLPADLELPGIYDNETAVTRDDVVQCGLLEDHHIPLPTSNRTESGTTIHDRQAHVGDSRSGTLSVSEPHAQPRSDAHTMEWPEGIVNSATSEQSRMPSPAASESAAEVEAIRSSALIRRPFSLSSLPLDPRRRSSTGLPRSTAEWRADAVFVVRSPKAGAAATASFLVRGGERVR